MNKVTKVRVKQEGAFGEEMPLGVDASNVMLEEGKDLETKLKEFISGSGEPLTIDSSTIISDFNDNKYLKSGIYRHSASYPSQKPENGPDYNYNYPGILIVLEEGVESQESAPATCIEQIFISNSYIYERYLYGYGMKSDEPNVTFYGTWAQIYPTETVIKATDKADALAKSKTDTSTIYYWAE